MQVPRFNPMPVIKSVLVLVSVTTGAVIPADEGMPLILIACTVSVYFWTASDVLTEIFAVDVLAPHDNVLVWFVTVIGSTPATTPAPVIAKLTEP